MPLKAFQCDVTHQPVHFDTCVGCAQSEQNKKLGCHHSSDILRGIQTTIRAPMDILSVTELLDCPRSLWLKKKKEYFVKPSQAYWGFRGNMIHAMIEAGKLPGDISEVRMHAEIAGHKISGQPDLIRGQTIFDWKSTSKIPEEPHPHHIAQVSMYRYLAHVQTPSLEIREGRIVYIDMKSHVTLPFKLWSLKDTEKFMREELTKRYAMLNESEPPPFADHFNPRNWKCGSSEAWSYCEVRRLCTHGQQVPEPSFKKRSVRESSQ
jgi:CRISPR/Cas system-associated exonuclease Cas4 (RecB family)